ncbi:hypothetical protein GGR56DRAFT_127129 [Xylariaceae sp. FL0804]|nr:hypothetical protein GGR56DRAFT_127129 [Xylariaceae sp. FL0804]
MSITSQTSPRGLNLLRWDSSTTTLVNPPKASCPVDFEIVHLGGARVSESAIPDPEPPAPVRSRPAGPRISQWDFVARVLRRSKSRTNMPTCSRSKTLPCRPQEALDKMEEEEEETRPGGTARMHIAQLIRLSQAQGLRSGGHASLPHTPARPPPLAPERSLPPLPGQEDTAAAERSRGRPPVIMSVTMTRSARSASLRRKRGGRGGVSPPRRQALGDSKQQQLTAEERMWLHRNYRGEAMFLRSWGLQIGSRSDREEGTRILRELMAEEDDHADDDHADTDEQDSDDDNKNHNDSDDDDDDDYEANHDPHADSQPRLSAFPLEGLGLVPGREAEAAPCLGLGVIVEERHSRDLGQHGAAARPESGDGAAADHPGTGWRRYTDTGRQHAEGGGIRRLASLPGLRPPPPPPPRSTSLLHVRSESEGSVLAAYLDSEWWM